MASVQECEAALRRLAARLAEVEPDVRRKHPPDRSVSIHVTDHDVVWSGQLREGQLLHIRRDDAERAQIRLATSSDNLLALTAGCLNFAMAWAQGKLKVDAGPLDLLRLRSLL